MITKCLPALAVLSITSSALCAQQWNNSRVNRLEQYAWNKRMKAIEDSIQLPVFRNANYYLSADDSTLSGLQPAIDSLSKAGGGTIVIPNGTFCSNGSIRLRSGIRLHLNDKTMIRFSTNPQHYLPMVKVRWEGTVCYNYAPLVYAYRETDIAITGNGTLDGQAHAYWHAWKKQPDGDDQEKDKTLLRNMGRDGVPEAERLFGPGHKLRPSFIEFFECNRILLESLTLRQSPFWTVHPVFSSHITIRGLNIQKGTTNDDGIDPDGCRYVLIEDCNIDTDDDPISIKAGRDNDAWQRPGSYGIIVRNINCRSRVGNGFCIGSEMSGGVSWVFVSNYHIHYADNGMNVKSNLDRGGTVQHIYLRQIRMDSVAKVAVLMQKDYHSYRGGQYPPVYQYIFMNKVQVLAIGRRNLRIAGVKEQSIRFVAIRNFLPAKSSLANEIVFTTNLLLNP